MIQEYLEVIRPLTAQHLWIILPLIGALIGWLTNVLAVKMLFRPRKPINLLLFKLQGVFPKRQKVLAEKIADLVATELLSSEELAKSFEGVTEKLDLKAIIVEQLDEIIKKKLPQQLPMLGMFLNNEIADQIKGLIAKELESSLSGVVAKAGNSISEHLDIKQTVYDKVSNFSSVKLEAMILSVMKKELRFVEYFGAIIGLLIGLIQYLIVSL